MFLRRENLLSCAGLMGYEKVHGFDMSEVSISPQMEDVLWEELLSSGMLEKSPVGSGYRVSELGQMILAMVCKPDAMVTVHNSMRAINRKLYIYHFYFLYIDESDGVLNIDFLPSLEVSIGAYARALEGIDEMEESGDSSDRSDGDREISIFCESGEHFYSLLFRNSTEAEYKTENSSGKKVFSEENCTNEITAWILEKLKETEVRDEQL